MLRDEQIVAEVLSGNSARFEELVNRYLSMVRGLCHGHIRDASVHDDLVQETFVAGYTKLDRLRDPARFGPWLATIARNQCKLWLRGQARKRQAHERLAAQPEPSQQGPLGRLAREELHEWVRAEIAALPAKTREAMALCYIEGHRATEAARFLGIRESAVKKRLQYGRGLLSEKLWAQLREQESPAAESDPLKRSIMAAVPLISAPWKATAAGAAATAAGSSLALTKIMAIGLPLIAITLGAAWWAKPSAPDHLVEAAPTQSPAAPEISKKTAAPSPALAKTEGEPSETEPETAASSEPGTGDLALNIVYRDGQTTSPEDAGKRDIIIDAHPVPKATVRLAPVRFNREAFNDLMREMGIPERAWDALALRFEVPMDTDEFKKRRARLRVDEGTLEAEIQRIEDLGEETRNDLQKRLDAMIRTAPARDHRIQTADAEGHAFFAGLPPGRYAVCAYAKGQEDPWRTLQNWHRIITNDAIVVEGVRSERTIQIDDILSTIQGLVVDAESGLPVSGVELFLLGEVRPNHLSRAYTNPEGRFSFRTEEMGYGSFEVESKSENHLPAKISGLREPGVPNSLRIELRKRAAICGKVLQADGSPAPGVSIMRANAGDGCWSSGTSSDEDGGYSMPHDGGVIRMYAGSFTSKSDIVSFELTADETVNHDFLLPPTASIYFDILPLDGAIPDRLWLECSCLWETGGHSYSTHAARENGSFKLPYLRPGQYWFYGKCDGYEGFFASLSLGQDLTDQHIRIQLKKEKTKTNVRILAPSGTPQPAANLTVTRPHRMRDENGLELGPMGGSLSIASGRSDTNGECTFEGLPPGEYQLRCGTENSISISIPHQGWIIFQLSQEAPGIQFSHRLPPGNIKAYAPDQPEVPLMTGDAALFTISESGSLSEGRLQPGLNQVFFIKAGYAAGIGSLSVAAEKIPTASSAKPSPALSTSTNQEITIQLEEGGGIYGIAQSASGEAITDAPLFIFPAAHCHSNFETREYAWRALGRALAQSARTGADGSFHIRFLPAGQYIVALSEECMSPPVQVAAGLDTGPLVLVKPE